MIQTTVNKFKLYDKEDDGMVSCNLCPHFCILKEGQTGSCYALYNKDEELIHKNNGSISVLAVEPITKKPFRHFLEDSKTLTLGGKGCNLSCHFCENSNISQSSPDEKLTVMNPWVLMDIAKQKNCKSISMSYNEPILSYEFLLKLARVCKINGLKFILKTNAFINKEPWENICKATDAMNIDWKGSEEKFKQITGVNYYVLQDRIKEAYDYGVHLEISFPLYYQDDEIEEEINIAGEFLSSIDKEIPCHLLPIQSSYKYGQFIFKQENLDKAKEILSRYMCNIYSVL